MDAESILELQKIDCNCNNCIHMIRDMERYQKWHDYHYQNDLKEFDKRKEKAVKDALLVENEKDKNGMLRIADKMKFQFNKVNLLNYGNCDKLKKPVCFIPNTCQLETQECFKHRKETI